MSLLPIAFQFNTVIGTMYRLFANKKILFSSMVYKQKNKNCVIEKNQLTSYFQLDWQCYSLLRSYSNTLITTGQILRKQHGIFKSQFALGDKSITEMYQYFKQNKKQNVCVLTKTMNKGQLLHYFNLQYYKLLNLNHQFQNKNQESKQKNTLYATIQECLKNQLDPILVECGPSIMNKYYQEVQNKKIKNLIDTVYICYFEGQLQKQFIGNQFQLPQKLYQTIWESQKFTIQHKHKNIGTIHFKVYQRENQLIG